MGIETAVLVGAGVAIGAGTATAITAAASGGGKSGGGSQKKIEAPDVDKEPLSKTDEARRKGRAALIATSDRGVLSPPTTGRKNILGN